MMKLKFKEKLSPYGCQISSLMGGIQTLVFLSAGCSRTNAPLTFSAQVGKSILGYPTEAVCGVPEVRGHSLFVGVIHTGNT